MAKSSGLKGSRKPMNNSTVNNNRERRLVQTDDGSFTFFIPVAEETYHSKHGAEQEGRHVFITHGLAFSKKEKVRILEVGMGTGLNVRLVCQASERPVAYTTLEPFPLDEEMIDAWIGTLPQDQLMMHLLHRGSWDHWIELTDHVRVMKLQKGILDMNACGAFDVIFFDAFGPAVEPELWTQEVMQKCFDLLDEGGIWVSYCAKGEVRRNLIAAGFKVERLPGPPGKREMLRAIK